MSLPAARRHLGYSMVEILICRKAVAGGHEITSLDNQAGNTDFDYDAMPDADAEEARESLIEEKTALRL